ncbi:MAG: mandelate racemase/muconate lactonizing enzyme family protein [Pseudomonadota bacterium]
MKLASLDVIITGNPPPGQGGRYFIFVKLTTQCGIVGWGEVYAASVGPAAMRAVIADVFERHFEGRHPRDVEAAFRSAYSSGFTQRPDLTVMGAFSGLEIACWDIWGKALGQPVWALLGGHVTDRLRAYTYLYPEAGEDAGAFYSSPERAGEVAAAWADQGMTAVKFDPAGPYTIHGGHQPGLSDLDRAEAFCARVREGVRDRADILFGTHGQFTPSGAIRMAERIAKYDPLWFEEPCPPDTGVEGWRQIVGASRMPIAAGERLTTLPEFAALAAAGVGVLQPALGRAGGLWHGKKIATIAEAHSAQIAPHLYAGPIEWLANLHLGATCSNTLLVETIGDGGGFHGELIPGGPRVEGGYIAVPTGPGLGFELNETLARENVYEGKDLHLTMQREPIRYDGSTQPFAKGD